MSEIYFSHDADAATDLKIQSMLMSRKAEGYGLYWMIVERMRKQEKDGYRLPLRPYVYSAIGRMAGVEPDEVRQFIEECCQEYELFVCDGEWLWSESLLRRMEIKDAKREQRGEKAKRAAEKRWSGSNSTQGDADAMPEHAKAMPEHATSMPEQCNSNAKHAKGKGKEKVKEKEELGSTPPSADTSTEDPVDGSIAEAQSSMKNIAKSTTAPLYHSIRQSYESRWDGNALPDYKREGPAIKRMVEMAHTRSPDDPESWARQFVVTHWKLKQDGKSLLNNQPFLPSIGMSSGLLPRVLEGMQTASGPRLDEIFADTELSEGDRRRLAKMGITA